MPVKIGRIAGERRREVCPASLMLPRRLAFVVGADVYVLEKGRRREGLTAKSKDSVITRCDRD